jgi:type VI protein secretion system component VasK
MIKIPQSVGWKIWAIVASVLVVGWTLYSTIQFIQQVEKDKITIEILEGTQEKRDRIRETIESNKPSDRGDATNSLQWLKSRQGDKSKDN